MNSTQVKTMLQQRFTHQLNKTVEYIANHLTVEELSTIDYYELCSYLDWFDVEAWSGAPLDERGSGRCQVQ